MNKDIVNIIVGDSIAYGYGDKEYFGWHNRLRKNNKFQNQIFFNISIPGQSSIEIIKRFKNEFLSRYNNEDIFNVIFAFGIKDALILSNNEEHISIFEKNISNLISFTKNYTNNIYFIGLLCVDLKIRTNYKKECIDKIDNTIKEICLKNNIKYIDMSNVISLNDLIDGLHPNENGYQKISDYLSYNLI